MSLTIIYDAVPVAENTGHRGKPAIEWETELAELRDPEMVSKQTGLGWCILPFKADGTVVKAKARANSRKSAIVKRLKVHAPAEQWTFTVRELADSGGTVGLFARFDGVKEAA